MTLWLALYVEEVDPRAPWVTLLNMQWLANLSLPCAVRLLAPWWRLCLCRVVRPWVTSSWVSMLVIFGVWLTSALALLRPCWPHCLVIFFPISPPFPPRSRVGGQRHSRDFAGCMLDLLVVRRLPLAAFEFMLLGRDGPLHSAPFRLWSAVS